MLYYRILETQSVTNYLFVIYQLTKENDFKSGPVKTGVPQGLVCGHLSFFYISTIFINSLIDIPQYNDKW